MAIPILPLINRETFAWASIRCVVLGKTLTTIRAIEYNMEQEMEAVYGAGEFVIGLGLGNKTNSGSITLLLEEVKDLFALSPSSFGHLQDIPFFDIVVSFQPKAGGAVVNHILQNVRIMSSNISTAQNDKQIEVELQLFIGNINYKG